MEYLHILLNLLATQVHEHLGLSFENTSELNKIIDKSLPGHPCFEQHELIIGDEVCEVYFWDVIKCTKALFGDPFFAPYLVFVPEKHYTDETKAKHMYHDMHTGRWWWLMQVRDLKPHSSNQLLSLCQFRKNLRKINQEPQSSLLLSLPIKPS